MQTSNLQQILTSGSPAQKIVINQNNASNKVVISSNQQPKVVTSIQPTQTIVQHQPATATIVQNPSGGGQATTQQIILNTGQKVVQQIVKASNGQQQIFVGG